MMKALESPWLGERVLCHDQLLVVDKLAHVPVHGGTVAAASVVERLKEHLRRAGQPAHLGVHQRLDQETSGVLLFTCARELDASVGRAFEHHELERVYVAVVEGAIADQGVFENRLSPQQGGRVHVVNSGGKVARTAFRVLERSGSRAMLELRPTTGRTHQLRVQLSHAGAPIVGDRLYGGATAPRLMLHALRLELLGRRFDAPLPTAFAAALAGTAPTLDPADVRRVLRDAIQLRHVLAGRNTAFRLVNGWGDEMPGVEVDYFEGHVVLALSSDAAESLRSTLVHSLAEEGATSVYVKCRRRADQRTVDLAEVAPAVPDAGAAAPEPLWVSEGDLRLPVWLADGLSTGLFLDQRDNRAHLRQGVQGLSVLNLFCYTGSFSAAAARGEAARVTSVDLSGRALDRARQSVENNGGTPRGEFRKGDAFEFIRRAVQHRERFDVVVLDPPSFGSRGRRRTFNVASSYEELAAGCFRLLAPGGRLLAVTNHRKTSQGQLRRTLHRAAEQAERRIVQMKDAGARVDFPDGPSGPDPSKSVWIRVE
ncbi:MAG: pseudouridine synthase [Polyangiaceae bacterium]